MSRLKQILINFVSNSIKFTKKGYIRVVFSDLNTKLIEVSVSDTGTGIEEKNRQNLFKPFNTFS